MMVGGPRIDRTWSRTVRCDSQSKPSTKRYGGLLVRTDQRSSGDASLLTISALEIPRQKNDSIAKLQMPSSPKDYKRANLNIYHETAGLRQV